MRKGNLDLHLLSRRDAAVEGMRIVENAPDQRMVFLPHRKGEFPPDQKMRQVGKDRQVGPMVKQIEREEKVRGHPVAMCFDEHRNAGVLGKPHPTVEQRQALLDPPQADIGLQVDVADRKFGRKLQRQAKIVNAPREADTLDLQAGAPKRFVEVNDILAARVVRTDAVEARLGDHRNVFRKAALVAVRVPALHRPQRLVDKQCLHHAARALFSSALRFTPGSINAAGSGQIPAEISISASLISLARLLPGPRPAPAKRRPSSR